MKLAYTISSNKDRVKKKGRHSHRFQDDAPKQSFKMLKDENGKILKAPRFTPGRRPFSETEDLILISDDAKPCSPSVGSLFNRHSLAWTMTIVRIHGGIFWDVDSCSCKPVPKQTGNSGDAEKTRVVLAEQVNKIPKQETRFLPRNGPINRRKWVTATGTPEQKEEQAAFYLRIFDHAHARYFDQPEFSLLKVICNLRNYHGMSKDQTVILMRELFNPKLETPWSNEAICLAWDLVADYTPWLGLTDVNAIAMQKAIEIEDAVVDLLAYTRSGHRTTTDEFFATFRAWNPDLETTKTAVSRAVHEITGIKTTGYEEGRCYKGFHLPSAQELMDPAHATGDEIDVAKLDLIIAWLRSLRRADPFIDFNLSMSIYKKSVYSSEENDWVRVTVIRPIKPFAFSEVSPLRIHVFAADHLIEQERVKILDLVKQKHQSKALPNFKIA
jgi:hypothetical protein